MVRFTPLLRMAAVCVLVVSTNAAPAPHYWKRVSQQIDQSTQAYIAICKRLGGGDRCLSSSSFFQTLLGSGQTCDQQDAADRMVDLAKQLESQDMIRLAQIFAQQPRNAADNLQVPYCQKPPRNAELNGFFHCQFQSTVASGEFSGDPKEKLPLGVAAVNPPGSCPALNGPVPDGQQLNTIVSNPGTPSTGVAAPAITGTPSDVNNNNADPGGSPALSTDTPLVASPVAVAPSAATPPVAVAPPVVPTASAEVPVAKPASQTNGQQAQTLNAKFATLTASSPCNAGEQACVGGAFAQCVGGSFVSQPCATSTQCFALPGNGGGATLACATPADAAARFAAVGVSGGVTGA